jgi:hypothetical protein
LQVGSVIRSRRWYTEALAGVDSEQLRWGEEEEAASYPSHQAPAEPTIEEDKIAEAEAAGGVASPASPTSQSTIRHVRGNSYNRLSRLSDEARLSIQSIKSLQERNGVDSNRSSVTIKGVQMNGTKTLNDVDFEKALRKFASERDSFLSDLTLSAGAVVPNRPKPRPRTQRIVAEDATVSRSGVGSIRRRISFRDMSSVKRQSSVARQCTYGLL